MNRVAENSIAVIGLSCRFPGAQDASSFWQMLLDGREAVAPIPAERWQLCASEVDRNWSAGLIQNIENFDPEFFGISLYEAGLMDPQQRLLLEVTWEAIESAGLNREHLAGSATGVFIGISTFDYSRIQRSTAAHSGTGNALSIAANRISYFLDLRGPSLAVDTACSSSLTAIHLAVESLRRGETSLALVGGVNAILCADVMHILQAAGMLAADGRCKTFDSRADGYVRGEGCGVVVLKRLSDAQKAGDRILAVIRGSAANQDGRSNGLTAPNGPAQEALIETALADAGLKPADIDFVEAHGTGTALGDPIEAMALDAVLSRGRLGGKPCLLGSVKTNIGHLEAAAGIAALIKTTLSLQHGRIPRSLHYRAANPRIPFDKMSVRVAEDAMPWPNRGLPSRAGISGFGFGGANVHVILESAPQAAIFTNSPRPAGPTLVAISAPSATALQNRLKRTEAWLADADRGSIEEISYSTTVRQTHFSHRWAAIVADAQSLRDALAPMSNENETPGVRSGVRPLGGPPPLVYVYSGQGAEVAGMGRALHGEFPKFRAMLEACDAEARSAGGQSILRELIEAPMASYSQPSQVAFQISLTALLSTFGLRADAVTGHSLGEISAAWAAGVLSLHDAMRLSVLRDKVMAGRRGSGGMLCIDAPHVDVASLLNGWSERAGIAAINGPSNTVVFATVEAQDELIRTIESVGLVYQRVRSESAFHSPHMDEARIELTRHLIDWQPEEEQIPFFSTRLGRRVSGTQLTAEYWGHQLRDPVQFSTAVMDIAHENPGATFLEIGAHPVLGAALNQCLSTNEMTCRILAAMRRQTAERDSVLRVLGELYVEGRSIRWEALFSAPNPKWVPLPGYTWQHKRCWTGVSKSDGALLPATAAESRSLREMTGRPAEERRQFLEAELRKAVARLLEIADAGQVAVDVEFMQMGLDSLMSAQLRIRAEKLVGRPLPGNFLTTHPTVTAVVDFIESAQAPAEEKTAEGELPAGIPRIERKQAEFPLSSAQERMWFQHLLSPESAVYTEHAVLRIHGDLNAPILRRSLQQMLDGEEALRLSFHERGGVVFQTVAATAELPWEEIDYSQEPPDRREELKRAATLKAAQRVFPLDRAPLFQATLLRVAADEHVLVLAAHHIVIDGWSFQMILDRVFRTHGQLLRGEPDAPALRQIEFCDYAQWEAGRRRAGAFTPAVDFWKRRLEGRAEVTRIRPDFSPTRTATKACAVFRFEVDTENLAGLRALAQREKTTLFTVMVAAFQTLLFSYLQENELAVGVPVSNRIEPEVENMVGMFVNTVALPSSIRAEDSLAAVLDKTKTAVQEALAHREAPFQDVVAALKRSGAADQNPLFEIVFDLQKASGDFLNEQGLRFEYTPIDPRTAKFDLVWSFLQTENALLGRVEYRADLFRPETIARLARHYQAILRALVEDSKVAVGRLPLLDPAEQAAAVAASKGPVHLPEAVATVHGLIEKRAAEQPLAPAVVEGGQCLTYGELNARANAFANALLRRGVQPRDRVAVVLEKSLRQCICLLAVAKCGATYVPLDPALPAKRLAGMLADARPRLVIASGDHSFDELAEIELCLADKLEADAKSEGCLESRFHRPARRSTLRDLHLRLDGSAKRSGRAAPRFAEPRQLVSEGLCGHPSGPLLCDCQPGVRRLRMGVLVQPGGRGCIAPDAGAGGEDARRVD
jgi:acyl transferase domain-containing protein